MINFDPRAAARNEALAKRKQERCELRNVRVTKAANRGKVARLWAWLNKPIF